MKRSKIIRVTTALMAGLVFIAGATWAGTIEIPFSGTDTLTPIDPGVVWTDEDGVTHYRGAVYTSVLAGQDNNGVPVSGSNTYTVNINIDMATGDGDFNARAISEVTYGVLVGTWEGRIVATYSGFVANGTYNYPRGDGDFEGWHQRGVLTGFFGVADVQWEGIIQIPGGGNKAAASESKIWSDVKALYR